MSNYRPNASPNALTNIIFAEINKAAAKIADFDAGAIGAMYVPLCQEAADWLGVHGFDPGAPRNSIVIRTTSINKDPIRSAGWRGDPERETVNCAAFVVQKLYACLHAMFCDCGCCSDSLPDFRVFEGEYNGPGAMGFAIMPFDLATGKLTSLKPWMYAIYGVSGATGVEDKWCAYRALDILNLLAGFAPDGHIQYDQNYDPNAAVKDGLIKFKPEFAPAK